MAPKQNQPKTTQKRSATEPPSSSSQPQKRQNVDVTDISFEKNASENAIKRYNDYFMHCPIHGERGIDYKHVSKEVKELTEYHEWGKFIEYRSSEFNHTVVNEFYATLSEASSAVSVNSVTVRKTVVPFTPKVINEHFEISEIPIDDVYSRLWKLDNDKEQTKIALQAKKFLAPKSTWEGKRFQFGSSRKDVRVIKHLINHNLLPSYKINTFNYEEACLTYAIMTKKPVDVGQIIFKEACDFAIGMHTNYTMPFPYLISELCLDAGVKVFDSDKISIPDEPAIGPSIQELKNKNPEPATTSSDITPPIIEPIPETSEPTPEISEIQSLRNELSELKSEVEIVKKGLVNLNDNMLRGFESINAALDNVRCGIRGHRELYALHPQAVADDEFSNCQDDPFELPQWTHILPATPLPTSTPSHPGGTSNVSTTGTTSQAEKGKKKKEKCLLLEHQSRHW